MDTDQRNLRIKRRPAHRGGSMSSMTPNQKLIAVIAFLMMVAVLVIVGK